MTSNYGLHYDLHRDSLAQYSLRGLELLAQDEGLTRLELAAINDEARERLTAAANA